MIKATTIEIKGFINTNANTNLFPNKFKTQYEPENTKAVQN